MMIVDSVRAYVSLSISGASVAADQALTQSLEEVAGDRCSRFSARDRLF